MKGHLQVNPEVIEAAKGQGVWEREDEVQEKVKDLRGLGVKNKSGMGGMT